MRTNLLFATVVLIALTLLAAPPAARATTISDNFGPGDTFNTAAGAGISNFIAIGAPFTPHVGAPSGTSTATDIVVALSTASTMPVTITFSLVNDATGHPGTLITTA